MSTDEVLSKKKLLGDTCFRNRNFVKAVKIYSEALALIDPLENKSCEEIYLCASLYSNRAAAYLKLEKPHRTILDADAGIELLDSVDNMGTERKRKLCTLFVRRGTGFYLLHQLAEAISDYQKAVDLSPEDENLYADLQRMKNQQNFNQIMKSTTK